MSHHFLDADEVAYLQNEITLEEAKVACADLGLPSDGTAEDCRRRLCAHYQIGGTPAAADGVGGAVAADVVGGAAALTRQGSAPPAAPVGGRDGTSGLGSTTSAPRAVVRSGWLEKKGGDTHIDASNVLHKERHFSKGGRRNWKARWFMLFSDGELHYYEQEPVAGEVLPPERHWKGALKLVGAEDYAGQPCCWHVRDDSPTELLLSLPSGTNGRRNAMLLRSEDENERQGWIAATANAFGATVAQLLHTAEERGMAESSVMAIRARLAKDSGGPGALDIAATLPPSEAVVVFDFAAQEPTDLPLIVGEVVVLTQTEGEWWHGHIAGVPAVLGVFPATYVARGTAGKAPRPAAGAAAAAAEVAAVSAPAPPVLAAPAAAGSQQRIFRTVTKGADGYGMTIEDDGLVSGFTFVRFD